METNPPLRAPSHRRTARQFVRVYPTYPDISTSRPGVARIANHPATFLTYLFLSLSRLHFIFPFYDFSFIFSSFYHPRFSNFLFSYFLSYFSFCLLLTVLFFSSSFFLIYFSYILFCIFSFRSLFLSFLLSKLDPVSRIMPFTGKIIKLTSGIHHGVRGGGGEGCNTKH